MILNLPAYQETNQIYTGTRTLVYRAIRNSPGQSVIIKVLRNPHPSINELVQFRNQYIITRHLEHPAIVKPITLERYGNGYALMMPDSGAIALSDYWQNSENTLSSFLNIAIQLAEVFHYLSQQHIIHKDIKPANILIHPETKQVQLIDFSISSLLPTEQQQLLNPNVLEGTLAYISPEQTGRMNRGIDYRSDFYSLGITLFELLTGNLPFDASDPMELVHCHIAQKAKFPVATQAPELLQEIVLKLMAKNAEDRYQSALGLKYDLEKCQKQLETTGKITSFELRTRDVSDRFLIPEKLYGREKEVQTLLDSFERVANSPQTPFESGVKGSEVRAEMMLVAGFSGIGKTAVVNEVHKPIVRQRGYFIKGKFDQFNRNIPFSAFVQAFRDLMKQLLSESDTELTNWKNKILKALGENAQLIIEVVPELENIIGTQPAIPELSGSAAQNRFNLLFQKFITVFTAPEHPVVIFLDDLQWADSASLNLMKVLMSSSEGGYLLLLGAYRDNEVFPAHPLMLSLSELKKNQAIISTITLEALAPEDINQLVADTLNSSQELAVPLTELVYQKTQGNPFFTTQFLKGLYEEQLIKFNHSLGYWECDLVKVHNAAITDDVVEFMAGRLQKLSAATQKVLKLAACIGNQFELETLAVVCEKSIEEVAGDIWGALLEGLILPISETYNFFQGSVKQTTNETVTVGYRFLHDRVQQAAYSLIPDTQKQITHYHIGQLLLEQIPPEARVDHIFEIVNQLNYGKGLIIQQKERDELAKLNLIACRKARAATAYQGGREYATTGLSLLGEDLWERQYEMSLEFHNLTADLASLCNDFEAMEQYIEKVITQTYTLSEQVNVYRIRILSNVSRSQPTQAIAIAQEFLQKLGVTFPEEPTKEDIKQAIAEVETLIGDREIKELIHLPQMTEVEKIAIVEISNSIMPAASMSGSILFPLLVSLSVKLSIQYGNISVSAFAYAAYGIIACNIKQDVDVGVKFGQLALDLVAKMDAKAVKPQVLCVLGYFILHRQFHINTTLPVLKEGYGVGLEVGKVEDAGYNAQTICYNSFWCGKPLVILEPETRTYCHALVQLNLLTTASRCRIHWQCMLNLLGVAENPTILSGEAFQEVESLELLKARQFAALYFFYIYKLMLDYLFEEIESAQNQAIEVRKYLVAGVGLIGEPVFYFYDSLTALAALSLKSGETSEIFAQVEANQAKLQQHWANYAPMNYQHKVDLVAAEICRVKGQKAEAIELYDQAIAGAKENEYIQEEALANELAAKFYLEWGKNRVAADYMIEAYYCYARWGAKAKTNQLETKYSQLLTAILETRETGNSYNNFISSQASDTVTSTTLFLDHTSAIKASRTISEEIELDALLSKLMQILIENAGANKGVLLLNKPDNWEIVAQCNNKSCDISIISLDQTDTIPRSIINTVKRTQKTLLLNNLEQNNNFSADLYLLKQPPKSLLCTPMINQGKLIGILYLENHLTTEAFTSERLEVLKLLTAQAAISIENARLYRHLENYSHNLELKVQQRTQELQENNQHLQQTLEQLQQTQTQLIQTEKMSSLGQMVAGIAHEINNPITFISGNISHARGYVEDLLDLLNLYQENSVPSVVIQDKLQEIDLEFLCDDIEKIFDSMQVGGDRIRQIILGLRNFSRLDESQRKQVDIHEGLENTLMILQHRLRVNGSQPDIVIVKNYGQLPPVNCYPSQLNQVFLSILTNAIDALIISEVQECPKIRIATQIQNNQTIRISIADNGPGMSATVQQRIFDPFFTTKPVGQGKGLGLSISYQIVTEQHGGKLRCISQLEKGTEFMIDIPI
ncbi:ATP-binding sensor histidine kinase [Hydrocoleum sp. CS-953]|uniref:trifunctional serine/threonine-protein kinase/ATP-binding protein/sensor histidine kinase n=1 Tax=Hydrocoleum sp. CS-953 TaxID=1671698 RepID=UPI000B9B5369|nr:ATP-binding sensor histidine kinase [Hydrocoleum sp. CS-953]